MPELRFSETNTYFQFQNKKFLNKWLTGFVRAVYGRRGGFSERQGPHHRLYRSMSASWMLCKSQKDFNAVFRKLMQQALLRFHTESIASYLVATITEQVGSLPDRGLAKCQMERKIGEICKQKAWGRKEKYYKSSEPHKMDEQSQPCLYPAYPFLLLLPVNVCRWRELSGYVYITCLVHLSVLHKQYIILINEL